MRPHTSSSQLAVAPRLKLLRGGALPLAAVAAEVAERVAPAVALMAGNHEARAASARASAWR
jgi:hypothetical protein